MINEKRGTDGLYDYQRHLLEKVIDYNNDENEWEPPYGFNFHRFQESDFIPEEMMIGVKRLGHSMQGTTCVMCGWKFNFPIPKCDVIDGEVIK